VFCVGAGYGWFVVCGDVDGVVLWLFCDLIGMFIDLCLLVLVVYV